MDLDLALVLAARLIFDVIKWRTERRDRRRRSSG